MPLYNQIAAASLCRQECLLAGLQAAQLCAQACPDGDAACVSNCQEFGHYVRDLCRLTCDGLPPVRRTPGNVFNEAIA
jgi:hypothetical protein